MKIYRDHGADDMPRATIGFAGGQGAMAHMIADRHWVACVHIPSHDPKVKEWQCDGQGDSIESSVADALARLKARLTWVIGSITDMQDELFEAPLADLADG